MTSLRSKRPQIVALLAAQRIQTGTSSQTDYIDPKGYWCDPLETFAAWATKTASRKS
jgi:hypothetical protein